MIRDRGSRKPFGSIADLSSPAKRVALSACVECGTMHASPNAKYCKPCSHVVSARKAAERDKARGSRARLVVRTTAPKVPKKCIAKPINKPINHCGACGKEVPLFRKLCFDCRKMENRRMERERRRSVSAARSAADEPCSEGVTHGD